MRDTFSMPCRKKEISTPPSPYEVFCSQHRTQKVTDTAKLEEALKNKGIQFKGFEVKPIFDLYGAQLQKDKVDATPSCVIEQNGKKELFVGDGQIINALEKLLK